MENKTTTTFPYLNRNVRCRFKCPDILRTKLKNELMMSSRNKIRFETTSDCSKISGGVFLALKHL